MHSNYSINMDYYHQYNSGYYSYAPSYDATYSGGIYNQCQQYPNSSTVAASSNYGTESDVVLIVNDVVADAYLGVCRASSVTELVDASTLVRMRSKRQRSLKQQLKEPQRDGQDPGEDDANISKRMKAELICQQTENGSSVSANKECDDAYTEHLFKAYQNGEITKSRYKRLIANERERKRMHGLNLAFESLRQVLPSLGSNKQFSKFETLQMAKSYIVALREILCGGGGLDSSDNGSNGEEESSSSSSSSSDYYTIKPENDVFRTTSSTNNQTV